LADGFQRKRLKCENLTDDRQQTTDAKSPHYHWQGELKRILKCDNGNATIFAVQQNILTIQSNKIKERMPNITFYLTKL
jgi:hypothetical protein